MVRLAGVMGWPIAHSRSPRLHGFWLARYGIDGSYLPFAIRPGEFDIAVRGLVACGFAGGNVTLPHKQSAFAVCDEVTDFARRAGAVNTLVFRDGGIFGDNTDGFGFLENLRTHHVDPAAGPALLLGAGGAGRAIAAALIDLGVPVTVANRTRARSEALAAELAGLTVIEWADAPGALPAHALLINATALGMTGQKPLNFALTHAPLELAVADIVYAPRETALLAAARARHLRAIPGLGMLLHQARPGFAAWFGREPRVDDELFRFMAADLPP